MHDRTDLILARIRRLLRERITPAIYRDRRALTVTAWTAPGEPVPFSDLSDDGFEPISPGAAWGRAWATTWLHVQGEVPAEWSTERPDVPEVVIDIGFTGQKAGFQAEGTVYSSEGVILKAVEALNRHVAAPEPGAPIDLYVEAAANPDIAHFEFFEPTERGRWDSAGDAPLYQLGRIEVALRSIDVWELEQDVVALLGLAEQLSPSTSLRSVILRALEDAADALDPHDVAGTATDARAALAPVLALPASASAHRIAAVGHAHIDSAWLWPTRETVRKVARTFSNVLALMDEDPDFTFAASSAQQYAWLQERYPQLFERVRARVREGRFVPVGGMWVESDTNLPGGEALARQLIVGKRYFMDELGVEPLEVWLPDSFGYSASLPQIAAASGSRWFLTQKISWNETNRMPHHTFRWEGIDGTRIFTHFPPADTYDSKLTADDLARAERQFSEKGHATVSLIPFGWGDGGGGPTREMIAAAHRTHDLEGSPRVEMTSPRRFFEDAEGEYPLAPIWRGELYLESHRGTYTTQAAMKRGNRRSEHLLREAEYWATLATIRAQAEYPYDELDAAWRTVLLLQFHDILPGSSIGWVHDEARELYAGLAVRLEQIIATSLSALSGSGSLALAANAGPYAVDGVPAFAAGVASPPTTARWVAEDGQYRLTTDSMRVVVDDRGLIVSWTDVAADRELVRPGRPANLLQLFRDTPTQWDAWDIDREYTHVVTDLVGMDAIELVDDGSALRITRSFGGSRVSQELRAATDHSTLDISMHLDWHETQKLLKLAFPLEIATERAASEIQFGHLFRPTAANTSWDAARYETVAQRWVHVGDAGYGVAVANDSTYGHDIRSDEGLEGGGTIVRLSLLRAPLYPDPLADQGEHDLNVSVRVGSSIPDAIELGYRVNVPPREFTGANPVAPGLVVDGSGAVIEAVKLADDRSGDVIVRLYEAHGARSRATLTTSFGWSAVTRVDLLERHLRDETGTTDGAVDLTLRPFELVTLRFTRPA